MSDDEIQNEETQIMTIPWYKKLLFKISPMLLMKLEARNLKIDDKKFEFANKLFANAERVDILPQSGVGGRGFIITIDNNLSLIFIQDGNRFVYDGYEIGKYENGNVTVFDSLKRN